MIGEPVLNLVFANQGKRHIWVSRSQLQNDALASAPATPIPSTSDREKVTTSC